MFKKLLIIPKAFHILVLASFIPLYAADSPASQKETVGIPADYYRNLGLPPITQPWTPNDYLQATNLLAPIGQSNPQFLPHYSDKTAAPYMQHMANGRNLYQVLQFSQSREQRLDLIMVYLDGIQRLVTLYQQAMSPKNPYYAEWLDLIALSSYLAALSAPEWQYYLAQAQSATGNNSASKAEAVTLLQTAMVNPVITGLQAMPRLSPTLGWRLVQQLNYSMPTYASTLPVEAQQQLYAALLQAYQQVSDQQLRLGIQQLLSLFTGLGQ